MSKNLDIGEVSKLSGLPPSTLRYYEEKKLIKSTGRNGLRRIFTSNVIERLALISLAQSSGFSLEEIANMFSTDGRPQVNRNTLLKKAEELDKQIQKLQTMRDGLRHTAQCPAKDHFECPTFKRLIQISLKKNLKYNKKKSPSKRR